MIGKVITLLSAVTATGRSVVVPTNKINKTMQVTGTFAGTVTFEGSLDGTNWTVLGSLTSPGVINNAEVYPFVSANVTSYTSGNITATVVWGD